ncbi:MAG: DUF2029 domain-containing protein [Candidatus Lokiarchaeota archaeon]|nr:DUF2029 domain-containing protein [Candidatus Lokiarchaeota archaeon]
MSPGWDIRPFKAFLSLYKIPIIPSLISAIAIGLLLMAKKAGMIALPGGDNDFMIYYQAARAFIDGNFGAIYDATFFQSTFNLAPYRYFPAELFVLSAYTLLDPAPAQLAFTITSAVLNVFTTFFAVRCAQLLGMKQEASASRPGRDIARAIFFFVYLVLPFQFTNFGMGQISSIVAFLIVLGFHAFLSGHELRGCFLVGASIFFKPVAVFIAFFLLLVKDFKRLLKRAVTLVLPLVFDALLFLAIPGLLRGFIILNMSEANLSREISDGSISSISLLSLATGIPAVAIMAGAACIVLVIGLVVYSKLPAGIQRVVFIFIFGMAALFIIQPDVWDTQLVYLYPFLAIAFTFMESVPRWRVLFPLYLGFPFSCLFLLLPASFRLQVLIVVVPWLLCMIILYTWHAFKHAGLALDAVLVQTWPPRREPASRANTRAGQA